LIQHFFKYLPRGGRLKYQKNRRGTGPPTEVFACGAMHARADIHCWWVVVPPAIYIRVSSEPQCVASIAWRLTCVIYLMSDLRAGMVSDGGQITSRTSPT